MQIESHNYAIHCRIVVAQFSAAFTFFWRQNDRVYATRVRAKEGTMPCLCGAQLKAPVNDVQDIGNAIIHDVVTVFTPTGDIAADTARAEAYAKAAGMDRANTKMAVVMATKGMDAGAAAMLAEHKGDYAAMRNMYG